MYLLSGFSTLTRMEPPPPPPPPPASRLYSPHPHSLSPSSYKRHRVRYRFPAARHDSVVWRRRGRRHGWQLVGGCKRQLGRYGRRRRRLVVSRGSAGDAAAGRRSASGCMRQGAAVRLSRPAPKNKTYFFFSNAPLLAWRIVCGPGGHVGAFR